MVISDLAMDPAVAHVALLADSQHRSTPKSVTKLAEIVLERE